MSDAGEISGAHLFIVSFRAVAQIRVSHLSAFLEVDVLGDADATVLVGDLDVVVP